MTSPKMRTAAGIFAEIKAQDPETEVTMHYIRMLISSNQIPVIQIGRKKLVDLDAVLNHLASGAPAISCAPSLTGQLRRVAV